MGVLPSMHDPYVEIHESGKVRRIPLGTDPLTIGRHSDNRLILTDNLCSRFHCLIDKGRGGYVLRDLNSSNGTALNGRLTKISKLAHGDSVTIGQTKIVFCSPNGQAEPDKAHNPGADDYEMTPLDLDPVPEPEPIEPEPLPAAVDLDAIPDEFEVAEALGEEDVIEEEVGAFDMSIQPEPIPMGDDAGAEPATVRDSAEVVERLVQSLPDRSFGETDIALVSARGQMVHPAGGPPPKAKREAVDWLRLLLLLCSRSKATDMHFEPKGGQYIIRTRIDATMVEVCRISNGLGGKLSALVKVLSEVDISQKNAVQEGHFSGRVPAGARGQTRRIDYRVSFAPSVFGQKLVIRVLDASNSPLHIRNLQLPDWMRQEVERVIKQDAGMVLVCGPTGSGKTTTLYALIRGSDIEHRNVVTIEDPVEIQIEGVTQIPVDETQDRTFSSLLRSTLRQDPDVILIGEIRDAETARIAMQAAITGHLVFSTLHTQNTIGTVFRLLDLGSEPYLVSQALHMVVAQRLVRQLCPNCKIPIKPTDEQLLKMGKSAEQVDRIFGPRGCVKCLHTGFAGRRAIFELLTVSEQMRELIAQTATAAQLQAAVASGPFQRLHESGYDLVAQGLVPFEEIDRAVGRDSR